MTEKFRLTDRRYIDSISSTVYKYEHIKTGASVIHIENDDDNKAFAIQFRTLPESDNGICHILEHSVLAGSRKYNVKEPFLELLKGSLNTFLNAMTYSDKTLYPFATTNDKEFLNLMDVYLDAVFFPNIYSDENILRQEGWHYELDDEGKELSINGVVYNEMKGALSQPERMAYDLAQSELYDNVYHVNSGGIPEVIPELTQDEFISFHRKYYHPSNSVSAFYGDMDIEKALDRLDEYLSEFDKKEIDTDIVPTEAFKEVKKIEKRFPVVKLEENQGIYAMGFSQGSFRNIEENMAMEILSDILFTFESSPVKNRILQSNLAQDMFADFDDSVLQPTSVVVLKGVEKENVPEIEKIITDELEKLVRDGIDSEIKKAAVNKYRFRIMEGSAGYLPKGLMYIVFAIENSDRGIDPFEKLEFLKTLENLETKIENGYLEELVEKMFIKNTHRVNITLVPDENLMEEKNSAAAEKMRNILSSMSHEEKQKIRDDEKSLRLRQTTPDTKENLDRIPAISVSDIKKTPRVYDYDTDGNFINIHTSVKDISYLDLQFEIGLRDEKSVKLISILGELMTNIGTESMDYSQLSNEIMINTGAMFASPSVYKEEEGVKLYLDVFTKYIDKNRENAINLLFDIMDKVDFSDTERIRTVLQMFVNNFQMYIMQRGDLAAANRLQSYFEEEAAIKENMAGIELYRYVKDIVSDFDNVKDQFISDLKDIYGKIFTLNNLTVFYQGRDYEKTAAFLKTKFERLSDRDYEERDFEFEENMKNEGFIIPSEVSYITGGYNFRNLGYRYSGSLAVTKKIIDTDYLWDRIRVNGGAYGASLRIGRGGTVIFSSYRDPNVEKSLQVYSNTGEYLRNISDRVDNIDKFIIGTIGAVDRPLYNESIMDNVITRYRKKITYEKSLKTRGEILSATLEDVKSYADMFDEIAKKSGICAIGSDMLKEDKDFNITEL